MATFASLVTMAAAQCKVGMVMIKGLSVQCNDVGVASLVDVGADMNTGVVAVSAVW